MPTGVPAAKLSTMSTGEATIRIRAPTAHGIETTSDERAAAGGARRGVDE